MAVQKALATAMELEQRLKLSVSGLVVTGTQDANGFPALKFAKGGDALFVKIETVGNADRVDGVGLAQRVYSPHKATILQDSRSANVITLTVTDWETGESVIPTVNGIALDSVAYNTSNNQSAADLATELLDTDASEYIASATANSGVITVTAKPGVILDISFAISGGDSISIVKATTFQPEPDLRAKAFAACAKLGMELSIYQKNAPASYDLTGAPLVAKIKSDEIHPLTMSQ